MNISSSSLLLTDKSTVPIPAIHALVTLDTVDQFLRSCKPADILLNSNDIKRIACVHGYDCHLRHAAFFIKDRKYSGLEAVLVPGNISLGVWGSLRQMQETDVHTYIKFLCGEQPT